jgi:citrate lyase subunit beta/citryl-CoA lyase
MVKNHDDIKHIKRTKEDVSRLRRTRLYIPGHNPAMIRNAPLFGADSVILDLEDSVAVTQKDSTRILVRNAIDELDFVGVEVTVRINPPDTEYFQKDIEEIVPAKPYALVLPKAENSKGIQDVCIKIAEVEEANGITIGTTKLMPIIESARGVLHAEEIADACERIVAISPGGEDLTADLGAERTVHGEELLYIRSKLVLAARAAGVQVLDTVYGNIQDSQGLINQTKRIIRMGFDGKACIHPSQIDTIHEAFRPTDREIDHAERIVEAYKIAQEKGFGVICVDNKMIDVPVVKRSERILQRASAYESFKGELDDEIY